MSRYHPLYWSLIAAISTTAYAANTAAHTEDLLSTVILPEANVTIQRNNIPGSRSLNGHVAKHALQRRSATLGDALAGELGVHSSHFGGGASAPIIRGQEGKRIKVLQGGSDVVDMSNMSPDHAVMVDTVLSDGVEIIRGASTLLHSSGNAAGVVNVRDQKIPDAIPERIEAEGLIRHMSANDEKLAAAGITVPIGEQVAVRVEGLRRHAGDYQTPDYQHGTYADLEDFQKRKLSYQTLDHLPDSWAESSVATLGAAWIGESASLGAAYTHRKDQYGLPAHNHLYDGCYVRIIEEGVKLRHPHLYPYPELASSEQVFWANPGVIMKDCHAHDLAAAPFVDLSSRRFDVQGSIKQPFKGIEKIELTGSRVHYQHSEIEGTTRSNDFKNIGTVARLELTQAPIGGLTGVWGVQYLKQQNSALSPADSHGDHAHRGSQQLLNNNTMQNLSVFGLQSHQWDTVRADIAARVEKQTVQKSFDHDKVMAEYHSALPAVMASPSEAQKVIDHYQQSTKPHKQTAVSVASGIDWQFLPRHTLSLSASHQQRLPTAQELYAHGMHLATNSFEMGNKDLTKEKSTNLELALSYQGERFDYRLSGYAYDFDNYIYLATLNADPNNPNAMKSDHDLRVNRYMQAPAKFKGLEASIGYALSDKYHLTVFGDVVWGKLAAHDRRVNDKVYYVDNPAFVEAVAQTQAAGQIRPWRVRNYVKDTLGIEPYLEVAEPVYVHEAEQYTPRLPPARAGLKIQADWTPSLSGELEYYRVFDQDKLARFESKTDGHDMLNLGATYHGALGMGEYDLFIKANNLLNQSVYAHQTHLPYQPQMGRSVSLGATYRF